MLSLTLTGAEVLRPGGLDREPLSIADGVIADHAAAREIDLAGYKVLPGMVDVHGDGFERHVAPRRGAMKDMTEGLRAAEAEMAANGVTTATVAQFVSWEGGMRGLPFADQIFDALRQVAPAVVTDMRGQLRFETHLLDDYDAVPGWLDRWGVEYVVFNDHLPHDYLAEGRRPKRLNGQALKAGRNPEKHFEMMLALHAQSGDVPAALDRLCGVLCSKGVRLGSHDDRSAEARAVWRARGVQVAEFPETLEAAEAARAGGDHIVMGSPNVVRGGSHNGNISAIDLISMGLCDALASDYHYPSLRRAALFVARAELMPLEQAWALVSSGPARVLGLDDRGDLGVGKRADLVILDPADRVAATIAGGRVSYMTGEVAARFIGG